MTTAEANIKRLLDTRQPANVDLARHMVVGLVKEGVLHRGWLGKMRFCTGRMVNPERDGPAYVDCPRSPRVRCLKCGVYYCAYCRRYANLDPRGGCDDCDLPF